MQNSSNSANMSEGLDEDYNEILNILNELLRTLDEISLSRNEHGKRLDTLIQQKNKITITDNR